MNEKILEPHGGRLDSKRRAVYPRGSIVKAAALMMSLAVVQVCATERDSADVVVIGAGIAGLAAALEAAERGAGVRVLELNSVGGGHAVMAGGLALVGTPLQEKHGVVDTPELAFADWSRWAETPNAQWLQRYALASKARVHDWLVDLGVEFVMLLPSPENSVRRFHFTRGTSVNVVIPMMRAAYAHPRIRFEHNIEVTRLVASRGRVRGVEALELRTGRKRRIEASAVIIATGGFESDLESVREHWLPRTRVPEKLLSGAGYFATGSGQRLASGVGARMTDLDRHTIFPNGVPDPRDAAGRRALAATHPDAIWVNAQGARFVSESADPKAVHAALMKQQPMHHWLVFDAKTRGRLRVRDAAWLGARTIEAEILANDAVTVQADSVRDLAERSGIEPEPLMATVLAHNATSTKAETAPISTPPFYAVRLYPMTRKSMGGIAVDAAARVMDGSGRVIEGLYAAGEATGVAGMNGEHGMSGTFLGPSVLMGRVAAETAVSDMSGMGMMGGEGEPPASRARPRVSGAPASDDPESSARAGYWHFARSHRVVAERGLACDSCHTPQFPQAEPDTRQRIVQLGTCRQCH